MAIPAPEACHMSQVVDSLNNNTVEFQASTPTGEVTVLKLQPTANAANPTQSDYQNVQATEGGFDNVTTCHWSIF